MDLSRFTQKPRESLFPSIQDIFTDIESINNYLLQSYRSQDGPVIQSLARDFLRLKTQFSALQRIQNIHGSYEELFVKNGRASLQALLKNCLLETWNEKSEATYLNFCVEFYQKSDKSLLHTKYRKIDTQYEFRFLFQSDNGVDSNLSLFIIICLLQLNNYNEIEVFLEGQYRELNMKSDLTVQQSNKPQFQSTLKQSDVEQKQKQVSIPQSQILSSIQNRLNNTNTKEQSQDQTYLQQQIDLLRSEQQQVVVAATEKIDKYKQKLGQYRSLEKELSSKVAVLETQNIVLTEELSGKNLRIRSLEDQILQIQESFQSNQQNNFKHQSDFERLKSENERYNIDLKIYQERAEQSQIQLRETNQELQQLRPQLLKATSEATISQHLRQKLIEMNTENSDLVQKYNSIVEQVQTLIKQQKSIQQDNQQAHHQVEKLESQKQQYEQLHSKCSSQQNEITQLEHEIRSLKDQLQQSKYQLQQQNFTEEINEKSQQLSQKLTENLKLKEKIATLEAQIQSRQQEIQDLQNNNNQKQNDLQQENNHLRQKLTDQQSELESTSFYKSQINQMKNELSALNNQIAQKQTSLDDKTEEIGKLKLQIQSLTADAAMQGKASELQDIIAKLKVQIQNLEDEKTEVEKRSRKLEIEVISSKGFMEQYEQLKNEYTEKCTILNKQKQQVQELKQQLDQKVSEIEMLQKQLDLGKEQLQQLTEQFTAIQESQETELLTSANNVVFEQQLQEKDDIIRDLRDVASQYQQQAHSLQEQLNQSVPQDRVTQLLDQTEQLTFKIRDLESENSELKKNSQDTDYFGHSLNPTQREMQLEKENKELKEFSTLQTTQNSCFNCQQQKQQIEMKQHEIDNLKDELDSTAQELEMLRDFRLKELEREIQDLKSQKSGSNDDILRMKLQHIVEDEIEAMGGLDYLDDEFLSYGGTKTGKNQEVERLKNKIKALIDL